MKRRHLFPGLFSTIDVAFRLACATLLIAVPCSIVLFTGEVDWRADLTRGNSNDVISGLPPTARVENVDGQAFSLDFMDPPPACGMACKQ